MKKLYFLLLCLLNFGLDVSFAKNNTIPAFNNIEPSLAAISAPNTINPVYLGNGEKIRGYVTVL